MANNQCFSYLKQCGTTIVDPDDDTRDVIPSLSLLNINYQIKEFVGPWWKGACLRKRQTKSVLNSINIQFKSGEMTAILGSSGLSS